jgi:hypothetical protein
MMLGAFKRFLGEVEKAHPVLYQHGEFAPMATALEQLSNETTEAGVRVSDMAVLLVTQPAPIIERMYFIDKLASNLQEFGAEEICTEILDRRGG